MPIIKSAVKRMKQTAKRNAKNTVTKRSMRAELKALSAAIEAKDVKKAGAALAKVQSRLDTAVKKGILKKNTAARKLAGLSAATKQLGAKPAEKAKTAKTVTKKPAAKKPATKKTTAKKTK